jgi:putative DNA methylase
MNTGVEAIARGGVIQTGGGKATLVHPDDMSDHWDPDLDDRISEWEVLMHIARVLLGSGQHEAAKLLNQSAKRVNVESVKELTYQLYAICERKNWSKSGQIFNALGASWNDLNSKAQRIDESGSQSQTAFSFDDEI